VTGADVARAAGFDASRLDAFLRAALPGLAGPMRLARIGGGQSNPTFVVDYDDRSLVLRKQPPGELLPSAHAVDREFRVLRALAATDVPVPRVHCFCVDRDVVGTPFYVMDKVEGRVFATHALPGIAPRARRDVRVDGAHARRAAPRRSGGGRSRRLRAAGELLRAPDRALVEAMGRVAHARQSGARQADRVAAAHIPDGDETGSATATTGSAT
jgi:aminoglycoside phosphotransferase (APT) family kinase protein